MSRSKEWLSPDPVSSTFQLSCCSQAAHRLLFSSKVACLVYIHHPPARLLLFVQNLPPFPTVEVGVPASCCTINSGPGSHSSWNTPVGTLGRFCDCIKSTAAVAAACSSCRKIPDCSASGALARYAPQLVAPSMCLHGCKKTQIQSDADYHI